MDTEQDRACTVCGSLSWLDDDGRCYKHAIKVADDIATEVYGPGCPCGCGAVVGDCIGKRL